MVVFEFVIMAIFLMMCMVWMLYKFYNNPSVVDTFWPVGLWISGSLFLLVENPTHRAIVIQVFLTIWMLRISTHSFLTRVLNNKVDKRYLTMSEEWAIPKSLGFFLNFQFQGLLIFIISLALYFSGKVEGESLTTYDWVGLSFCYLGLIGETLSDMQRNRFLKNNKDKEDKACDVGLWKYLRHPNYFFECLVWVGFAITALPADFGYLAFISPATVYLVRRSYKTA